MTAGGDKRDYGGAIAWGSVAVLLSLVVVFFVLVKKEEAQMPETKEKAALVETMAVEATVFHDVISLPGRIEAKAEIMLGVERGGLISHVAVDKGDRVRDGQVLLKMDDRLWKVSLRRAEIEAADAAKDYDRLKNLRGTGAVSDSDFDNAEIRKRMTEVALEEAMLNLSKCDVRSPVDGIIDERFVEKGEFAGEGKFVFKVADTGVLKLVLNVPERDVGMVKAGSLLPFTIGTLPGHTFTGQVSFVSVLADRGNNSYRVEAVVKSGFGELRSGMIAEVAVNRGVKDDAIVIPMASVIPRKGVNVVFVEKDGFAARRVIKFSEKRGHSVVVTEGIAPGERLITEGHRTLLDGTKVRSE